MTKHVVNFYEYDEKYKNSDKMFKRGLLQPGFRIMRLLSLPEFEMELRLSVDGVHKTEDVTGLHLVVGLDRDILQFAV